MISVVIENNTVDKPITKRFFIPRLSANNNPPPIVIMHVGHIIYDKIYQYKLQTLAKQNEALFIVLIL